MPILECYPDRGMTRVNCFGFRFTHFDLPKILAHQWAKFYTLQFYGVKLPFLHWNIGVLTTGLRNDC